MPGEEVANFILIVAKPEDKLDSWTYKNIVRGAIRSIKDDVAREDVMEKLKGFLPPESFVKVLEQAPFRAATWSVVEEMDDQYQQAYWSTVQPVWEGQTDEELNEIVDKLIEAKRPRAAFNCVDIVFEKLRPVVLFKLMEAVATVGDEPEGHYQLQPYDIEKAFKILDSSDTFSVEQMAGLEFAYMDALLEYGGSRGKHGVPNLENYIVDHPEFFVQVVAWVYKRRDSGADPKELRLNDPLHIQNRAKRGYKLIEGLQSIPGRNKQGEIDADLLLGWVNTVRNSCAELGRQDVGDISLGKLLAEAPKGADDVWPCEPVRQVLEQIQSEKISEGITVGLFNSRGVHARGEGGDQERELAAMYRKWASALEFSHPFVASNILKYMADRYESYAQSEDTEAIIRRRLR